MTAAKKDITKALADKVIRLHDDGKSYAEIVKETGLNLYKVWAVLAASGRTKNSKELVERAQRSVGDAVKVARKAASGKPPVKKEAAPKRKVRTTKVNPKALKKASTTKEVKQLVAANA